MTAIAGFRLWKTEETEIIKPAIADARTRNIQVFGPYPADGFFGAGHFNRLSEVEDHVVAATFDVELLQRIFERFLMAYPASERVDSHVDGVAHGLGIGYAFARDVIGCSVRQRCGHTYQRVRVVAQTRLSGDNLQRSGTDGAHGLGIGYAFARDVIGCSVVGCGAHIRQSGGEVNALSHAQSLVNRTYYREDRSVLGFAQTRFRRTPSPHSSAGP